MHARLPKRGARKVSSRGSRLNRSRGCVPAYTLRRGASIEGPGYEYERPLQGSEISTADVR